MCRGWSGTVKIQAALIFYRHHRRKPMPTIRVELFEGRTLEQKRALASAITEAVTRTLGGSADGVDILFYDIARHDWATGGQLWSDKGHQQAQQQQ
jgi:4-oxalocrotonate tautomerase